MANLYYREDLDAADFEVGATVEVMGDEAHHAVRVSRLREGEEILVGNGRGAIGRGAVTAVAKDRFSVRLDEAREDPQPGQCLVLVQALAKGDRDERAVEQATEFGVDAIVPWEAARSVSRWGAEKAERGAAKWRRIAREASKQALRARIPATALYVAEVLRPLAIPVSRIASGVPSEFAPAAQCTPLASEYTARSTTIWAGDVPRL
mgnify:CR=1 FL=1